jgi:hypothetical protein
MGTGKDIPEIKTFEYKLTLSGSMLEQMHTII